MKVGRIVFLVLAAVAVVGLAACSDSEPSTPAADAAKRQMQFLIDRQFDRQWDELHPAQQKVLAKDDYVACANSEIGTLPKDTKVSAKAASQKATDIPLTDLQDQTATEVVLELSADGEKESLAFPVFLVDGKYRWMLNEDTLRHCLDFKDGALGSTTTTTTGG